MWRRLSFPHPLRILYDNPFPAGTCFKHAITHGRGPRSLLTHVGVGAKISCRSLPLHAIRMWLHALTAEVGTCTFQGLCIHIFTSRISYGSQSRSANLPRPYIVEIVWVYFGKLTAAMCVKPEIRLQHTPLNVDLLISFCGSWASPSPVQCFKQSTS